MTFDPEFTKWVENMMVIFWFGFMCFVSGGSIFWVLAWLIIGFMDFFTDEIKYFKSKFVMKYRHRKLRYPTSPPEFYLPSSTNS